MQALSLLLLPLVSLALGAPTTGNSSTLPPCDATYRPCSCPEGATFKNLTSYGVIGAAAIDVQDIMGKFLSVQYQGGLTPSETTGEEGVPGATRTFNFSAPAEGQFYQSKELLVAYETQPDGSFLQVNQMAPEPSVVPIPGGGTYMGQWSRIEGQQTLVQNETAVAWKNWRCEIGFTFAAAESHEGGINNASAVLTDQGRHTGVDIEAFTIWHETRQD